MKYLYSFSFILMFLLSGISFYKNTKYKANIESLYITNNFLKEDIIFHTFYGGEFDLSPTIVIKDTLNKMKYLKSLVENNSKLVFRISDLNCNSCIEDVLPMLKEFINSGKNNVIILTSHSGLRSAKLLVRDYNFQVPIYSVSHDQINHKIDSLNVPYLFILTQGIKASKIFFPNKRILSLTKEYFEAVKYEID